MDRHWKQTKPRSSAPSAPSALLVASSAPTRHTFVLAPGELDIPDRDARMMAQLVKELLDEDDGMGGTPDKRNTSLKTQCGFKSSCTGYATGAHTRWLHSIYNGTSGERAASKEELLPSSTRPAPSSACGKQQRQRAARFWLAPRQEATQRAPACAN